MQAKLLAYVGSQPGTRAMDRDAWFTPADLVERARRTMGGIDLDPFSCEAANRVVKAKRFFSEEDSAFGRDWSAIGKVTVFINPPFGRGIMDRACRAFLEKWAAGQISKAVVLVNNATETAWFQSLLKECGAICLVSSRIAFYNDDGKAVSSNTRGQVFLYFGQGVRHFTEQFSDIGVVMTR